MQTKKIRPGPLESATLFKIGTKKRGNDKHMWIISKTNNGTHRWKKLDNPLKSKSKSNAKTKTLKKSISAKEISLDQLKQLKNKYNVSVNGSKKEMAQGLWALRRSTIEKQDLQLILYLLSKKDQKIVGKILYKRNHNKPITNYKGLWEPQIKPIETMSRTEMIKKLRQFRDAWEKTTKRNQNLEDDRLKEEPTDSLRTLIKFYYSNSAKLLAEEWIHD